MIKNKLLLICTFLLILCSAASAQIYPVGPDVFVKGTSVEYGIRGIGGFEGIDVLTSPTPAGMHLRSANNLFGFVANPQLNSWAGSAFDGDFFTPGSPENGWGFEIGTTGGVSQGNNCSYLQQINGAITGSSTVFNCYNVDWEGDCTSGTDLHFKINYFLQQSDLYYTTTVSITNNTSATIPDMYYYRNLDPDNNEELSFNFTTQNTIVSQPGTGCNLAHVSATQSTPWNSYLGLAAIGANWRCDYGGFANRDASDLWNGGVTGSGTFTQTVGSTNFADEGISLAYRIQNLAPGATETFKFLVILDAAAANNAINNVLYFTYPGSATAPPAVCTPYSDTVRTCGGPVPVNITGPIVNDYTWTWTPTTGLSPATGPNVVANPAVTTTYTATGTPLSTCVNPVTLTFVVEVTPGGGTNPYITPVPPLCISDPAFNLAVDSAGGTWTGTGITSPTLGTFDPNTAGAGTFLITYSTSNVCNSTDTMYITVSGTDPTIAATTPVCAGSAPFTMTAASAGGVWAGTGITSSSAGTFDPTTAGTFAVTYTISGTCTAVDTQLVVVNPVVPPVTGISYTSPVCISGPNPTLTTVPGFTTGGTYSVVPAGLSISTTSGAVNLGSSSPGTYTITYSYPATTCGPAGSSSASLVVNPLAIPVLGFSYPTVCISDTTDPAPVQVGGFTTGGVYSATPAGLSINDSTGVVDLSASTPGTYTVSYSVIGSGTLCTASGTGTASITINPLPTILVSSDAVVFLGQSAWIYATGGTSYNWTPALGLSCASCDSSLAAPEETTTYCVAVTDLGCVDSACLKVVVELPCPSNRNMGVPNAFTPNNDGVNDKFCLDGWADCINKFEIVIFDRWGEKVFESKDPDFCWDGVYKGKALDPAVFIYYIKANYAIAGDTPVSPETAFDVNRTGNISLVR
ncbi:MAG TPA: gliding motility-associated C-terminal domain-containing protein [Bacteroidia bacterium]|jgi:gliding motility-associated-like protein